MSADREHGGATRVDRPAPAQTILYRSCPECRASTLDSADGPVAVAPERVADLHPVSNHVRIAADEERQVDDLPPGWVDEPNGARLSRQVLHRDGLRCANPGCGRRRDLHAHHIVFRSRGGPTALSNEVAVCDVCHALLHKGLLEVTGTPDAGLIWQPRPIGTAAKVRDVAALRTRLRQLPGERPTLPPPRAVPLPAAWPTPQSYPARFAVADATARVTELAQGLVRLGFTRAEGEQRVRWAIAALSAASHAASQAEAGGPSASGPLVAPDPGDDEAVLLHALRGRCA